MQFDKNFVVSTLNRDHYDRNVVARATRIAEEKNILIACSEIERFIVEVAIVFRNNVCADYFCAKTHFQIAFFEREFRKYSAARDIAAAYYRDAIEIVRMAAEIKAKEIRTALSAAGYLSCDEVLRLVPAFQNIDSYIDLDAAIAASKELDNLFRHLCKAEREGFFPDSESEYL